MSRKLSIWLLVFIIHVSYSNIDGINEEKQPVCPADGKMSIHRFFGTKTLYQKSHAFIQNNVKNISIPESCEPIMFYMFKRHAIRYPDGEEIVLMDKFLNQVRKLIVQDSPDRYLCQEDIRAFKNWNLNMVQENDNDITESGIIETKSIGSYPFDYYS